MRLLAALLLSGVAVLATLSNADDSVDSKAVNDGRIVPSEASHTVRIFGHSGLIRTCLKMM